MSDNSSDGSVSLTDEVASLSADNSKNSNHHSNTTSDLCGKDSDVALAAAFSENCIFDDSIRLSSDAATIALIDDSITEAELTAEASAVYVVYWQRWLMIFVFGLLSMSNNMAFLTYATNANTGVYYNASPFQINMLAVIYEIVYVFGSLFAGRWTEKIGLAKGLRAGAALNIAGAVIRVLPWPFIDPRSNQSLSYGLAVFGQILCAAAQLFILATPALVAENWFPSHERVTATGLGSMANQVGLTLAFATAQIVLPDDYSNNPIDTPIHYYTICHAVIMILAGLCVFLLFKSKPPTPPSASQAAVEQQYDLGHVLKQCLTNVNLWLLLMAFGAAQGTSYAVNTLLYSFMTAQNYASQDINVAGVLLTLGGVVSPAVFGLLADRTRRYKGLILVSMISTTVFSIFVPLISYLPPSSSNTAIIQLFAFLLGFAMASIIPLALDVNIEVTYPLPPSVTCTLCMIASNGAGILITFLVPEIQNDKSNVFAGFVVVVYMLVSTLIFVPFNARSKRLDEEAAVMETVAAAVSSSRAVDKSRAQQQQLITVHGFVDEQQQKSDDVISLDGSKSQLDTSARERSSSASELRASY